MLERVSAGEPLPADEHLLSGLEALLDEAEASGEPAEMTSDDWDDIRQEGTALVRSRTTS